MPKIGILGGGIVGLVSACILSESFPVTVIADDIGGTWKAGGLKILKWHPSLVRILDETGVPFFVDEVEGAVWWRRRLLPLHQATERIQQTYYRKTRGTLDGFDPKCMNEKNGVERVIDFEFDTFIRKILRNRSFDIIEARIVQIGLTTDGVKIDGNLTDVARSEHIEAEFDWVITTLPLWVARRISAFRLPKPECRTLWTAEIVTEARQYWKYRYVYFPKGRGVHRVSAIDGTQTLWTAEMNDYRMDWRKAIKTIRKVIPDAVLGRGRGEQPGHLLPLKTELKYPYRVYPAGRFASWNTRETVDVVAEKIEDFKRALLECKDNDRIVGTPEATTKTLAD